MIKNKKFIDITAFFGKFPYRPDCSRSEDIETDSEKDKTTNICFPNKSSESSNEHSNGDEHKIKLDNKVSYHA